MGKKSKRSRKINYSVFAMRNRFYSTVKKDIDKLIDNCFIIINEFNKSFTIMCENGDIDEENIPKIQMMLATVTKDVIQYETSYKEIIAKHDKTVHVPTKEENFLIEQVQVLSEIDKLVDGLRYTFYKSITGIRFLLDEPESITKLIAEMEPKDDRNITNN